MKIPILISLLFISNLYSEKIDLNTIILEKDIVIKKYQDEKDYLNTPILNHKEKEKKKDNITLDTDVDFNKEQKSIEGVKINIGTKF